ncbi:MAG: transglycosylase SLT domain-containing protein, partial [Alphaproteobacteria bacterium]|nr:transglycosylase SLT domain-containing protein [Alphaproteobacteria bacterium]
AHAQSPQIVDLRAACERAVVAAAARNGVPEHIARAVAGVESGFHPFALNIDKASYFPAEWTEAARLAEAALRRGAAVDIGCMQINISRYHRNAFATLGHALHPAWNAEYGAKLLRTLYDKHGDWTLAVAYYHSGRRDAQIRYVTAVGERMRSQTGRARAPAISAIEARARAAAGSPLALRRAQARGGES